MCKKISILLLILFTLLLTFNMVSSAHSGGTDSKGGHYDYSTGEYHYHHGYSAHKHTNGVCPYESSNSNASFIGDLLNALIELIGAAIGIFGGIIVFCGCTEGGEHNVRTALIGLCIIWFAMALVAVLQELVAGKDMSSAGLFCLAPLLIAGALYWYIKKN